LNKYANTVTVCPLTTTIKNYQGALILEPIETNALFKKQKYLWHTRSTAKKRLKDFVGSVDQAKKSLNDILYY
jgi:mRNA interferase MazF